MLNTLEVFLASFPDEVSPHLPDKPTPKPREMKSYFQFEDMFSWKYDPQRASVSWISGNKIPWGGGRGDSDAHLTHTHTAHIDNIAPLFLVSSSRLFCNY